MDLQKYLDDSMAARRAGILAKFNRSIEKASLWIRVTTVMGVRSLPANLDSFLGRKGSIIN